MNILRIDAGPGIRQQLAHSDCSNDVRESTEAFGQAEESLSSAMFREESYGRNGTKVYLEMFLSVIQYIVVENEHDAGARWKGC